MASPTASTEMPPTLAMLEFIHHFWASRAVYAAAKLKLADVITGGPKTASEVAASTNTHPASMFRLLRALASVGIFTELADGRFDMTPMAQTIRAGVPGSLRAFMMSELGEDHYPAWGGLMHSLKTGEKAFDHVFGTDVWTYYAQHPAEGAIFSESMSGITAAVDQAVLESYDFSPFKKLLDVGGGHGGLLAAILARNPAMHGVVLDMPAVIEGTRGRFASLGLAGRTEAIAGDFFQSVPAGADACMMKFIIHDWNDEQCVTILKNCRRALPAGAKLLVIEAVIPAGNDRHLGKFMDLNMLVMTGGRERTEAEFRRLLESGGFRLQRIVPTPSLMSIVEAVRE